MIKEQNMLDVYDEIEGYCNLLIERVHLIAQERLVKFFKFIIVFFHACDFVERPFFSSRIDEFGCLLL